MHVEGYPVASLFMPRVVSAELIGSGPTARAVDIMCEGGELLPGTENLSAGGGAPVPCSEAPRVFRAGLAPTRDVSLGVTLTLREDFDLFAAVDYQGGHGRLEGNLLNAFVFNVLGCIPASNGVYSGLDQWIVGAVIGAANLAVALVVALLPETAGIGFDE